MAATALALLGLHATLIAVRGGPTDCPSTRQVNEAIAARLPGVIVPPDPGPSEGVLLLTMSGGTGSELGFSLLDWKGAVRLERTLPPARGGSSGDCAALAETVALIVERYLQDLAYQDRAVAPPPPPPPPRIPRWELFVGATWQPGGEGISSYEARLGTGRVFGRRGMVALEALAGVQGTANYTWQMNRTGRLWRFPAEVRLLGRWSLGQSMTVEAGPFGGAQLYVLGTDSPEKTSTEVHVAPLAGVAASLRLAMGQRGFIRLLASGGVAVVRYSFSTLPPDAREIFGTERVYGKMGLETGLLFW